jgi:membrane protein implicated in regulation of membrane protease activity
MGLENFTTIELIYWASAIGGGTFFIARTVLMFIGGDLDNETDVGGEHAGIHVHTDGEVESEFDVDHVSTDFDFKLLSMQGITAFFMMFGLVGLALFHSNIHAMLTAIGGTAAGLFTVYIISLVFMGMSRLQSDGTLVIDNAIGQSGKIYLSIPSKGSGQVQVVVQGALKIFDAVSEDGKKIITGESVKIIKVIDGNTLLVEKLI